MKDPIKLNEWRLMLGKSTSNFTMISINRFINQIFSLVVYILRQLMEFSFLFVAFETTVNLCKSNHWHRDEFIWVRIIELCLLPDPAINACRITHNQTFNTSEFLTDRFHFNINAFTKLHIHICCIVLLFPSD